MARVNGFLAVVVILGVPAVGRRVVVEEVGGTAAEVERDLRLVVPILATGGRVPLCSGGLG